ncbi:MMPL family transporter [bacterium]|nr:MMPL family transporter [bacterium]
MKPLVDKFWKKSIFEKIADNLIRFFYVWILLGVVLTGVSFYGAKKLSIDSDYLAFLPDNFPGVVNLKKVIQKTGGFGNFMLVLEGATPEVRREYAKEFTEKAQKLQWVEIAEYKKNWEKIKKNKFLFLSVDDITEIKNRIDRTISFRKNPLTIDLFDSRDQKNTDIDFSDIERKYQSTSFGSAYFEDPDLQYTIAIVWPKGSMTNIDFAKKSYLELQQIVDGQDVKRFDPNLKATIGGEYRNKVDEFESVKSNLFGSSTLSTLAICILLFVFFRRVGAVFYIMIPLVLGTLWNFGAAYFLVGRLNLLTIFLVAILFGFGIDFGIYLFSQYMKERAVSLSLKDTIAKVLYETGRASFSAAITTSLSFCTLIFADFKGYQEFGILISVGIFIQYFAFFIYSPIIWILAEKLKIIKPQELKGTRLWIKKTPLSNKIVYMAVALLVVAVVGVLQMKFEYNYGNLRSKGNTYWQVKSKIYKVFPLSKTPAVVITDSLEETKAVVDAVNEIIPKSKTVDTVKSILDFLPQSIEEKRKLLAEVKDVLLKNRELMKEAERSKVDAYLPYLEPSSIKVEDLPKNLVRQFKGLEGVPGYLVFIYDKVSLSDARNAMAYANDIREIKTPLKNFYPAEGSFLFADAINLMKKEAGVVFAIILVGIFLVVAWDFGSFKSALFIFVPMSFGLLLMSGIMGIFDLKLNVFNLINFPILLCLGLDTSIHLYHHYHLDPTSHAIQDMVSDVGNSALVAISTTLIGFLGMLFTDHQGLQSVGLTAVIGLVCLLVSTLFFYPAFLYWTENFRKSKIKTVS